VDKNDVRTLLIKSIVKAKVSRDSEQPQGFRMRLGVNSPNHKPVNLEIKCHYIEFGMDDIQITNSLNSIAVLVNVTKDINQKTWADEILNRIDTAVNDVVHGRRALHNSIPATELASKRLMEQDAWWSKMTTKEQEDYLKQHPRSRKRVQFRFGAKGTAAPEQQEPPQSSGPSGMLTTAAKLVVGLPTR
jgi:hypothetical protein